MLKASNLSVDVADRRETVPAGEYWIDTIGAGDTFRITDLEGNVIGINISRNNRSASYAIPSSHIEKVLPQLREKWNVKE